MKKSAQGISVSKVSPLVQKKAKENMLATQNNKAASAMQISAQQVTTRKEVAKLAGVSHDTLLR